MNDSTILDLYFARDERALAETERQYGALCHSVAYHILRSDPDSEECVNDTLLRAWNSIPPARPSRLSAFLCRITRNLAIDRYRAHHNSIRNRDLEVSLSELAAYIPLRDEEAGELSRLLNDFLATLEREERMLFCGRYWHHITVRELSRLHRLTPKAVTNRLYRTREKLRAYLNERGYRI